MREYSLKLKLYVAWKKMHPEELEFLHFWKNPCMPIEVNMIEFCPYIPTNSSNAGPANSSFLFISLLSGFFKKILLRRCRLDKYPLQSLKNFSCQPKQSLKLLGLQHHGNTFIRITEFICAATYSPDLCMVKFKI